MDSDEDFWQICKMPFTRVLPEIGKHVDEVCKILHIDSPKLCLSFEIDLSVNLLEAIADYDPTTDELVLRTHCMCKDTLEMFQYAIARELTKKWVYLNDKSDWIHYPGSYIRDNRYMEEFADGLAYACMGHFYPYSPWDGYGICDYNNEKYQDRIYDIIDEAESELKHLLTWENYYCEHPSIF